MATAIPTVVETLIENKFILANNTPKAFFEAVDALASFPPRVLPKRIFDICSWVKSTIKE
jgi:hypothetical protein